ncbi:hypothetical protein CTAYLR_001859 [Chrysophaeum taylorii]|uniref:Kinesin-like protein n=1 Tax=Chrysophaeum taylorii TaxID=2483200 RepID=A0AAD7XL32_9STRA|nr:hypothetical protein CTAYLR_001859 [Chrysophaeum taylorii]
MAEETSRVNVFARLRPFSERENEVFHAVRADEASGKIAVEDAEGAMEQALRASFTSNNGTASFDGGGRLAGAKTFEFDGVFDAQSTQADVMAGVGLPVLNAVLQGYHGCIFAYGQTGSGKTFTLLNSGSTSDSHQEAGLLPRLVATLFVRARMDAAHAYAVEAASFQIYNEQVDDLLHPRHREGVGHNLSVSRTPTGQGVVDDLTWIPCSSANELLEFFARARKNVIYAETKMNKASSRSHACFQLRLSRRPRHGSTLKGTVATLSVIDLAGSERVKRSGVSGKEFKEAVNINGSLLALGNVVSALATGKKHVPYRDSKLTRLLEGRVGGNCRTNLVVCASPSADSVSETMSTLSFAARAMRVKVAATINEVDDVLPPDDANGLALVETSGDAARSEAERKLREDQANAALESRRRAEEALAREREAKNTALLQERKVAERERLEARRALETERKAAERALREERRAVERSKADVIEHKETAMKLKVAWAELDAENKKIKDELKVKAGELEAAREAAAEEKGLRRGAEERESGLRGELRNVEKDKSKLEQLKLRVEDDLKDARAEWTKEKLASEKRSASLSREIEELEATTLATKRELDETREALRELQTQFDATAKHSIAKLEEERRAAADRRARLAENLERALREGATLRETVATVEAEHDTTAVAFEASRRLAVVETLTSSAIAKAYSDAASSRREIRLRDVERRATSERRQFAEREAVLHSTVTAQAAELEAISHHLSEANNTLDALRDERDEALASRGREREKHAEQHAQLEQQLQALEERARCELDKAELARDTASADREALVSTARDLERRLAEEVRANADLITEIARVREENVAATIRYQENLQVERERGSQFAAELEDLARRFEGRESREQDLDAIDKLRSSVHAERQRAMDLMNAALQTQRELEHARHVDRIFGPESARSRKHRDQMRRLEFERTGTARPTSARRRPPHQKIQIRPSNHSTFSGAAVKHSVDV